MKTLTILSECSKLAHRSTRGGMMRLENVSIGKSVKNIWFWRYLKMVWTYSWEGHRKPNLQDPLGL